MLKLKSAFTVGQRRAGRTRAWSMVGLIGIAGCGVRSVSPTVGDSGVVRDGGEDVEAMACVSGAPCNPGGNVCQLGGTSCASGTPECTGATKVADGTLCGTNQVCDAGACVACAPGILCNPGGNPCQTGVTSCSSGTPACTPLGNVANGAACGSNEVCFDGACSACVAGAPCTPDGDVCRTGTLSCSTGVATCMSTGDVPDGTFCAAGICCLGACAACETSANATSTCSEAMCSSTCNAGFTLCGSACVDSTTNSGACGPSCLLCPTGSTCVASQCTGVVNTVRYGNSTEFSPCGILAGSLAASALYGQKVTITRDIMLTAFGVFGNQPAIGVHSSMALYGNSANGAPSAPVAFTGSLPIGAGDNELPVSPPVPIPAGTYWIMGQYDAVASICTDNATTNLVDLVTPNLYGFLPNPFAGADGGAPLQLETVDLDYYVIGTD